MMLTFLPLIQEFNRRVQEQETHEKIKGFEGQHLIKDLLEIMGFQWIGPKNEKTTLRGHEGHQK